MKLLKLNWRCILFCIKFMTGFFITIFYIDSFYHIIPVNVFQQKDIEYSLKHVTCTIKHILHLIIMIIIMNIVTERRTYHHVPHCIVVVIPLHFFLLYQASGFFLCFDVLVGMHSSLI
jgi:hypothetical protein